jgi:acetolactate synthase-1/2/3 large subunit
MRSSIRPVVIAGGGAALSDDGAALTAFAETTHTPVVTAMKAEGVMEQDHPLYGGSAISVPIAAAMGATADLVILLGTRIGLFTGGRYGIIPAGAKVIQIDIDGAEPGRGGPIDLPIMADCRQALLALTAAARDQVWPSRKTWAGQLRTARTAPNQRWAAAAVYGEDGLLHPFHAAKALAEAMPHDAVMVCDGGESSVWIRDHIRPRGRGAFLITGYLGTLGVGQGFAIGAARAFPDRPVVLFAGDGGVGFHIQEFDTMVRHGLQVVTVVLNNACWGMSQNGQDLIYGKDRRAIVSLADSAYEKVAEAFGGYGVRVTRLEEIGPAVQAALESGRPACINVRIDGSIINPVTLSMIGLPAPKDPAKPAQADKVVMPYYENVD